MGTSSSSAFSFPEIVQSCLEIGNNKPKPGFIFSCMKQFTENVAAQGTLALQQKSFDQLPGQPGVFTCNISANFDEIALAATVHNSNGLDFDSLLLSSNLPVTDNMLCNFQAALGSSSSFTFGTDIRSKIASGNLSMTAFNKLSKFSYEISSGFAINDYISLGLGLSQDDQTSPFNIKTATFINFQILQFSASYAHLLGHSTSVYTFGTNFILDPTHILNVNCIKAPENETANLGYFTHIGGSDINCTVSTEGGLTTLFSRQIAEDMKLTAGAIVTFSPLSCSPSIELQISA